MRQIPTKTIITDPNTLEETELWMLNNKKHRVGDLPAVISKNKKEWWQHGKRHRKNGPAVIAQDREEYWIKGVPHRIGAPAIILRDTVMWYQKGKVHRDNGPAIIILDGHIKKWYKDGEHHREDGPAVIRQVDEPKHGYIGVEWWLEGNVYSFKEWMKQTTADEEVKTLLKLTYKNTRG